MYRLINFRRSKKTLFYVLVSLSAIVFLIIMLSSSSSHLDGEPKLRTQSRVDIMYEYDNSASEQESTVLRHLFQTKTHEGSDASNAVIASNKPSSAINSGVQASHNRNVQPGQVSRTLPLSSAIPKGHTAKIHTSNNQRLSSGYSLHTIPANANRVITDKYGSFVTKGPQQWTTAILSYRKKGNLQFTTPQAISQQRLKHVPPTNNAGRPIQTVDQSKTLYRQAGMGVTKTNLLMHVPKQQMNTPSPQMSKPSLQMNRQNLQSNRLSLQMNEPTLHMNRPSLQMNQPNLQSNKQSLQMNQPDLQMNQPHPQMNRPTIQMNQPNLQKDNSSVQMIQPNLQMNKPYSQMNQPYVQMNRPSVQVNQPNLQMNKQSLQMNHPNVPMNQPNLQMNGPGFQMNQPNLQKDNRTSLQMNKPNLQMNKPYSQMNQPYFQMNRPSEQMNGPNVQKNKQSLQVNEPNSQMSITGLQINRLNSELKRTSLEMKGSSIQMDKPNPQINGPHLQLNGTNLLLNKTQVHVDPELNGGMANVPNEADRTDEGLENYRQKLLYSSYRQRQKMNMPESNRLGSGDAAMLKESGVQNAKPNVITGIQGSGNSQFRADPVYPSNPGVNSYMNKENMPGTQSTNNLYQQQNQNISGSFLSQNLGMNINKTGKLTAKKDVPVFRPLQIRVDNGNTRENQQTQEKPQDNMRTNPFANDLGHENKEISQQGTEDVIHDRAEFPGELHPRGPDRQRRHLSMDPTPASQANGQRYLPGSQQAWDVQGKLLNSYDYLKTDVRYSRRPQTDRDTTTNPYKDIKRAGFGYAMQTVRQDLCTGCFRRPYSFIINSPEICADLQTDSQGKPSLDLLVLITSSIKNRDRRNAIRQTWASVTNQNRDTHIRYAFLLGHTSQADDYQLFLERNIHKDILLQSFQDSYRNLTLKTLMGLEWRKSFCPGAKYIMKTDDDVYVNLWNLHDNLVYHNLYQWSIFGFCSLTATPIRDPFSKWYVSHRQFPHMEYPGFCSGTGYVMTGEVANAILNVSLNVPFFYLEDVYISLCASRIGVRLQPVEGFSSDKVIIFETLCGTYGEGWFYTSHGLSPDEMLDVWGRCR